MADQLKAATTLRIENVSEEMLGDCFITQQDIVDIINAPDPEFAYCGRRYTHPVYGRADQRPPEWCHYTGKHEHRFNEAAGVEQLVAICDECGGEDYEHSEDCSEHPDNDREGL